MKAFYLILCVCFAVFITIESEDATKKYTEQLINGLVGHDACKNMTGVTIEYIMSINKTVEELEAPGMEEDRTKIGCFLSCLMQEQKVMNGTVINSQKVVNLLTQSLDSSEEHAENVVETLASFSENCLKQIENITNVCSISWKYLVCMGQVLGV